MRITEALAQIQEGVEVIVEQNHRPVAVIKAPQGAKSTSIMQPLGERQSQGRNKRQVEEGN
jgi:antitoxin (DNA-binding transcriptional repressor) of toxin-antitoxin stability system